MKRTVPLVSCCIIILCVALSAVRYIELPDHDIAYTYGTADFDAPLTAAQRILIGEKLDINVATEDEFQLLVGIGPARAARIVADRERNGPFSTVYDLTRVHGIGPKTLKKNRHFLKAKNSTVYEGNSSFVR